MSWIIGRRPLSFGCSASRSISAGPVVDSKSIQPTTPLTKSVFAAIASMYSVSATVAAACTSTVPPMP